MAPVNLSIVEQCFSAPTISTSSPLVDPSTYESPTSIAILGASDAVTIDLESSGDNEISDEEMINSYKIMYEKLAETINENRGFLKQIS